MEGQPEDVTENLSFPLAIFSILLPSYQSYFRDSAKGQGRRDGGGRREEGGWEWGKGESGEGLEAEGVEVFL